MWWDTESGTTGILQHGGQIAWRPYFAVARLRGGGYTRHFTAAQKLRVHDLIDLYIGLYVKDGPGCVSCASAFAVGMPRDTKKSYVCAALGTRA